MAIGPNDDLVVVATEATRLESEFDGAIAQTINRIRDNEGIIIAVTTQLPPKELFGKVCEEIENRYQLAGWREAVVIVRDDSSLVLKLYKN